MRFHRDVKFEELAEKKILAALRALPGELTYSRHAKLQTVHEKYGIIPVLKKEFLRETDLFEYHKSDTGAIEKAVFRIDWFPGKLSHCYSVSLDGVVVTCWTNEKTTLTRPCVLTSTQNRRMVWSLFLVMQD